MGAYAHRRLTAHSGWSPAALSVFFIYGMHRLVLWQWVELEPWWMRNYLSDVLCLPVILTLTAIVQRYTFYRNSAYRLTKLQVVFTVIYVALLFEGILPYFMPRYTADFWDIAAYTAGAIIYWKWMN